MTEDIKPVATYLTSREFEDLQTVMQYHGNRTYAEVLRQLIVREAREIREATPLFAAETQEAQ